ncbi:MAG TPA: hypothetical protein P5307_17480 [Pirellulaceae bacterium]|nr:hypothetical protein [Planctomycetales bacterium]MCB9940085.1 hypothetical protein [Planctomycetaceae bacterium]HRX80867.1 hypothetical protein [Pirellulaceae bacterium]
MPYPQTLEVYKSLEPGDRVEVQHEVKVGFRTWMATTVGTVVKKERRRHSLHYNRNFDDKVYSDIIVLKRDAGDLTTVTLDEFSELTKLESSDANSFHAKN